MSELGKILKSAREEKGWSVDDLQDRTKIQKRYIEAIENGKYHLLPGPFYTRAFIKNIAETLGLDAEQLLEEYKHTLPSSGEDSFETTLTRRRRPVTPAFPVAQWVSRFLVVLFVVLILFLIYYFAAQNLPEGEKAQPQNPSLEQEQGQMPLPSASGGNRQTEENPPSGETPQSNPELPEAPKPVLTLLKEEKNTGYYELANAEQVELAMKAEKGRCWYRIAKGKGGELIDEAILETGQEKKWTLNGVSSIYIDFGAAKNVHFTINGQPVDLSRKRDVYDISVTVVPPKR